MVDEKDRFGETMKLVERAKEDIYFAQRDRELIEKLKAQLHKTDQHPTFHARSPVATHCNCPEFSVPEK